MGYSKYQENLLRILSGQSIHNSGMLKKIFSPLIGLDTRYIYKLWGGNIVFDADGHYCLHCLNDRTLPDCHECEEGTTYCEEGCEEGYFTCDSCAGEEQIICEVCEGTNTVECPECEEGYINCHFCIGEGNLTCADCDGEGNIICEKCKGKGCEEEGCEEGFITCDCDDFDTPDGTAPCDDCEGDGLQRCDDCLAEGVIECASCDHEGYDDCDSWDCDGGYVSCEYCDGGTTTCDQCEGLWEGEGCEICSEGNVGGQLTEHGWNTVGTSLVEFSKAMNENLDFPLLKWTVKDKVVVAKYLQQTPSSDTIIMYGNPILTNIKSQGGNESNIIIDSLLISPDLFHDIPVFKGRTTNRNPQAQAEPTLKALNFQMKLVLDEVDSEKVVNIKIGVGMRQNLTDLKDSVGRLGISKDHPALILTDNIYFEGVGLMNWDTATPWL